uniref:Uncharacterized protein n=1 Tax=Plectus sambesii TaxID=2011161 RepID=A0A914VI47_9BILA
MRLPTNDDASADRRPLFVHRSVGTMGPHYHRLLSNKTVEGRSPRAPSRQKLTPKWTTSNIVCDAAPSIARRKEAVLFWSGRQPYNNGATGLIVGEAKQEDQRGLDWGRGGTARSTASGSTTRAQLCFNLLT